MTPPAHTRHPTMAGLRIKPVHGLRCACAACNGRRGEQHKPATR